MGKKNRGKKKGSFFGWKSDKLKTFQKKLRNFGVTNIIFIVLAAFIIGIGFHSNKIRNEFNLSVKNELIDSLSKHHNSNEIIDLIIQSDSAVVISAESLDNYEIKKDIISLQEQNLILTKELENKHKSWISQLFTVWSMFGIGLGLLGSFVGYKNLVTKTVADEFKNLSNDQKYVLETEIEQIIKHLQIKDKAKIKVLTAEKENSPNLELFEKVMRLYKKHTIENKFTIDKFEKFDFDAEDLDLILLENQIEGSEWYIVEPSYEKNQEKLRSRIECLQEKIKKTNPVASATLSELNKQKEKLESELDDKEKWYGDIKDNDANRKDIKDLIVKINRGTCGEKEKFIFQKSILAEKQTKIIIDFVNKATKAGIYVLYYGSGKVRFPDQKIELKEKFTFANAPSQLYQNLLNILKYKAEIED